MHPRYLWLCAVVILSTPFLPIKAHVIEHSHDTRDTSNQCFRDGVNLTDAKNKYAADDGCALARKDCDRLVDTAAGYRCAAYAMSQTQYAQGNPVDPVDPVDPVVDDNPAIDPVVIGNTIHVEFETQSGDGWTNRGTYIEWTNADSYSGATGGIKSYSFQVPTDGQYLLTMRAKAALQTAGHSDWHNDVWMKMDGFTATGFHDVTDFTKVWSIGNGEWQINTTAEKGTHNFTRFRQNLTAGTHTLTIAGRSKGFALDWFELTKVAEIEAYVPTDDVPTDDSLAPLIILAHDSGPDTDDLSAIVANRHILDYHNAEAILVNGTTGHAWEDRFIVESRTIANALYTDKYDRRQTHNQAVGVVGNRVANAILEGRPVFIAEGGPSDWTAYLLKWLGWNRPEVDRSKIVVVQHAGWNENQTTNANLALVKSLTEYRYIGNGNSGSTSNGVNSADLQENSTNAMCQAHIQAAQNSSYAAQWSIALNKQVAIRKCDFSDSVELLHILGDTTTQTMSQFTQKYVQ